ncbi:MAG: hypothetical protein H7835_13175, partial [Magnetococcus sp. XQGC-1]
QLGNHILLYVQETECQKGLLIHQVRGVEIGEEPVQDAVRQYGDPGLGDPKIPDQLVQIRFVIKGDARHLTLDEHNGLATLHDGIINFFALLGPNVRRVFRDQFSGVMHIVTQGTNERDHKGLLGGLFVLNVFLRFLNPARQDSDFLQEIHCPHPPARMLAAPRMEAAGCLKSVQHDGETAFTLRLLYNGPTPGRRESVEKVQQTTADERGTGVAGISSPEANTTIPARHMSK